MLKSKYILFAVFLLATVGVSAQKAERDYIRKGNRLFNDSVFVDAEVNYRKALEASLQYLCTIWEILFRNSKSFRMPWNNTYRPAKLKRIK